MGAVYSNTRNLSLATTLNTTKDVTIFVPNNIAFETVRGSITTMSAMQLQNLLSYHVVPSFSSMTGPFYSDNFTNGTSLPTLYGNKSLTVSFIDNAYFINSARIITSDLLISNGVMHVIDNVLSPNATAAAPNPTSATQVPVLPTTGTVSFNSSAAPFTTDLPELMAGTSSTVVTMHGGAASGTAAQATVGGGQAASTTSAAASTSATSTSGAAAVAGRHCAAGSLDCYHSFGVAGLIATVLVLRELFDLL